MSSSDWGCWPDSDWHFVAGAGVGSMTTPFAAPADTTCPAPPRCRSAARNAAARWAGENRSDSATAGVGPLTRGLQARRPSLRGTLNVTDAPTNFAFRAWLRAGDREWPMSTIIIHQGKSEPLNLAAFNLDDLPGDVQSVDIVLKPDLYTADASFEPGSAALDVEILIPGVPVKSGEATTGFVPTGGR